MPRCAEDTKKASAQLLAGQRTGRILQCVFCQECALYLCHTAEIQGKGRKKNHRETLGKGSTKTATKAEMKVFNRGKISFNVQENVRDSNIENPLDLCLTVRK